MKPATSGHTAVLSRHILTLLCVLKLSFPACAQWLSETWVATYDNAYPWSIARALAVDSFDDILVAGYSYGPAGKHDLAVVKYSNGFPLWSNRYPGHTNAEYAKPVALAIDSGNCVIVAGTSLGNATAQDFATIKYSSAGIPLWTNRYNGVTSSDDDAYAIAVDKLDNVIVTGRTKFKTPYSADYDFLTIKYSSLGVPLWTNFFRTSASAYNDEACAVAIDSANNVIVTGYSYIAGASNDFVTIKYSPSGLASWTNRYNGTAVNSDDRPSALAIDDADNIVVTGLSTDLLNSGSQMNTRFRYRPIFQQREDELGSPLRSRV